jgi:hypothetical protein
MPGVAMTDPGSEALIRQIVRGEREWSDLATIGILILPVADGYEIVNDRQLSVVIGSQDVAAGIIRLAATPERLTSWASLLMAGSLFTELDLGSSPDGEILLNALWDLMGGAQLDERTLAAARRLAEPQ